MPATKFLPYTAVLSVSENKIHQAEVSDGIVSGPKDAHKVLIFLKKKLGIYNAPIRSIVDTKDGSKVVYWSSFRLVLKDDAEYDKLHAKIEHFLKAHKWKKVSKSDPKQSTGDTWMHEQATYLTLRIGPKVYAEGGIRFGVDVVGKQTVQLRVREVNHKLEPDDDRSTVVKINVPRLKLVIPENFHTLPFNGRVDALVHAIAS